MLYLCQAFLMCKEHLDLHFPVDSEPCVMGSFCRYMLNEANNERHHWLLKLQKLIQGILSLNMLTDSAWDERLFPSFGFVNEKMSGGNLMNIFSYEHLFISKSKRGIKPLVLRRVFHLTSLKKCLPCNV